MLDHNGPHQRRDGVPSLEGRVGAEEPNARQLDGSGAWAQRGQGRIVATEPLHE